MPQAPERGRGRCGRKGSGRGPRKGASEQGGTSEHSAPPEHGLQLCFPSRHTELLTRKIISGCVTACGTVLLLY